MPLTGSFKIKDYQRPSEGILIFNLASPINETINGEQCSIDKITISSGVEIKGEILKEKKKVFFEKFVSDGLIHFPNSSQKNVIVVRGRKVEIRVEKTDESEILDSIDNDFNINIDYSSHVVNPDEDLIVNKYDIDFEFLFQKVKNYIQRNPNQFSLSKDTLDGRMTRGVPRTWWSPENPEKNRLLSIAWEPSGGVAGAMRQIEVTRSNGSKRYLHPNNFSKEQYEELKNLLPNNRACKLPGCYNNFCRIAGVGVDIKAIDTKVENGRCGYHRAEQEGRLEEHIPNENEQDNNFNATDDAIRTAVEKAHNVYQNSTNLTEINQTINILENIRNNHGGGFDSWGGEEVLNELKSKKLALESNNENSNSGGNNGGESPETTTPNTNSTLQTIKDNAIREITTALVNQEPKLTTKHDLSEVNQDWKKKINESNSQEEIEDIKNQVLSNIQAVRKEKQKSQTMRDELNQARGGTPEQQAAAIEKAENSEGESSYQENADEVQKIKEEYFKKDKKGCLKTIVKTIENKLNKNELTKEELSKEGQKILAKLKSEEVNEVNEVNEGEKKLNQEIGEKGATKKITNLVKEVEKVLKSGSKKQVVELKKKLMAIVDSSSIYMKKHKSQANKLLNDLKKYSSQNPQQSKPSSIPWRIIVPSVLGVLVLVVLGLIIRKRREKKKNKIINI